MLSDDSGWTRLAVRPHPDDADQRNVVLVWEGVEFASLSAPNDEAISGDRLWRAGLDDVPWLGLVEDSELIACLKKQVETRFPERRALHGSRYARSRPEAAASGENYRRTPCRRASYYTTD